MASQHIEQAKQAIDGTIGIGALTLPWWHDLTGVFQDVAVIGGALLVLVRLAIALRDWWRGRKPD